MPIAMRDLNHRIPLAFRVIEVLVSSSEPLRAEKIVPGLDSRQSWFRAFLSRLADEGLIQKLGSPTRARTYQVVDVDRLDSLTREEVTRLLLTSKQTVVMPPSDQVDLFPSAEDSEEVITTLVPPEEEGEEPTKPEIEPDVGLLLAERLTAFTDVLVEMRTDLEQMKRSQNVLANNVLDDVRAELKNLKEQLKRDPLTETFVHVAHDEEMKRVLREFEEKQNVMTQGLAELSGSIVDKFVETLTSIVNRTQPVDANVIEERFSSVLSSHLSGLGNEMALHLSGHADEVVLKMDEFVGERISKHEAHFHEELLETMRPLMSGLAVEVSRILTERDAELVKGFQSGQKKLMQNLMSSITQGLGDQKNAIVHNLKLQTESVLDELSAQTECVVEACRFVRRGSVGDIIDKKLTNRASSPLPILLDVADERRKKEGKV